MIVAEVGQNFCGDMDLAKQLIILAQFNGADLVKFQLYDHNRLYGDNPIIPNVELSFAQAKMLFDYGERMEIEVFFSVFDVERVKWCEEIGVKRYKLACGFVHWASGQNIDLGRALINTGKPLIVSFARYVTDPFAYPVTKLYCVPKYPTQITDVDFGELGQCDGFSDHTIGLDASKIALARGARMVEKHFCIDNKTGIDAAWSMTPEELRELKRWERVCREVL